jgi:arylsulfatase A-like enzyme
MNIKTLPSSGLAICLVLLCALTNGSCRQKTAEGKSPNFIIIFCDDLGYGDIGAFGHPTIRTPHLDRMAQEGQKWTGFYVACSVCSPSRAALLTGRYPIRSGMCSDKQDVFFPDSTGGLPAEEVTIAEILKPLGYTTACVGKWHLGHLPPYLPTRHGFDSYFGIPYSNDMDNVAPPGIKAFQEPRSEYWNIPLLRDEKIIERPVDQFTLTQRYTEEAVQFIRSHRDTPFFLYYAQTFPHVPLFASRSFQGKSRRGLYGDVIEEIDASVGQILDVLRETGLDKNTLVVFTSDNGPWLIYAQQGGSAGPLREGKRTTWEGGMRVPAVFWWPGKIEPSVEMGMGSTLDLLPTICSLSGAELPAGRTLDGYDLKPVLLDRNPSPRKSLIYYRGTRIYAVRKGPYKAHFITKGGYGRGIKDTFHDPPLLFHLEHDPSEQCDIASYHPGIIAELVEEVKRHRTGLVPGEDQLAERTGLK